MKVAIYNKWLDALGGGEKVTAVMAETLKNAGHDVSILSTFDTELKVLEDKMAVNLRGVKLVALKEKSFENIAKKTKEYDLFINTSFLDVQPSQAKHSLYYIHFPSQVRKTILGFIKYETILPFLRKCLVIPHIQKSLDAADDIYSRSGMWLKKHNTIILSNPPKTFTLKVHIYSNVVSYNALKQISFNSHNSKFVLIDKVLEHHTSTLCYKFRVKPNDTQEMSFDMNVGGEFKKKGFAFVSMAINDPRYLFWNLMKKYLPRYEMALYGSGTFRPEGGLDTYDLFLANSKFTQKWTKRYWKEEAKILNPPVDVHEFIPSEAKKNIILNVGRFFVGGHSKRQDILVDTFKEMYRSGNIAKDWEFHLVGGIAGGWEHADYVRSIQKKANGYPIYFHFSASFDDLKKLYSVSKIYWHATGYQQYVLRNPGAFEHFGISVVEAMAAGCVPVVFKGGGLPETVKSDFGFLWKNTNQLKKATIKLIKDRKLLKKYSEGSINQSRNFSRDVFSKKLLSELEILLNEKY